MARNKSTPAPIEYVNDFAPGQWIRSHAFLMIRGMVIEKANMGTDAHPVPAWKVQRLGQAPFYIRDEDARPLTGDVAEWLRDTSTRMAPLCVIHRPVAPTSPDRHFGPTKGCGQPSVAYYATSIATTGEPLNLPICQRCIDELTSVGVTLELSPLWPTEEPTA